MRSRLFAIGLVLALAGCTEHEAATASAPAPSPVQEPAASAGGICILWDYDFIADTIGVRFDVAAARSADDTATCVVGTQGGTWPYLALAVAQNKSVDADLFADGAPKGSSKLKGLGQTGYRVVGTATDGHGPTIEISWLSEAKQLQTLKFVFAPGAKSDDVSAMSDSLLDLAKAMDTTNG
ncbi:hypothetical protein [Mangrovihabitans endophyticus]|uniref:Uncharacterized protein n=1 Tax=Mangrovihabitans endophyticus TaxID=1751298 RepID=A0A8J3C5R8_9ACTN|nr:hypothetical protein [Mangrovihabitans endophyticus]GGL14207.1 hypothetical protein GCM10012284_56230 [Mangrovihabitans endophyticus]